MVARFLRAHQRSVLRRLMRLWTPWVLGAPHRSRASRPQTPQQRHPGQSRLSRAVQWLRSLQVRLGVQCQARMRMVLELPSFGRAYHHRWWQLCPRVLYDLYPAKHGYGRASTAEFTASTADQQCPTCRNGSQGLGATLTWARGPSARVCSPGVRFRKVRSVQISAHALAAQHR